MSEKQNAQSQLLETTSRKKNGMNGKNGKQALDATSIYFKVAIPTSIVKRDGRIVPFDDQHIYSALERCFASLGQKPKTSIEDINRQVVNVVAAKFDLPTVEGVQDIVEMVLQAAGEYEAAKHYILYRAEHAKIRAKRPVPPEVRDAFAESDQFFPTQLQKFQFYDKYSRFNYDLGRRETWLETVNRATDYLRELSDYRLPKEVYERIRQGILQMKVMPSMRLLAMAGPAARRNNIAIYNCSYMPVDSLDSFVEALIISMSGCGVGFSVERQYVEQFPRIARQSGKPAPTHVVADTSEGWAEALRAGLTAWFTGDDLKFDYSEVRPAGMPLRVKGGRASGPEPLRQMLDFARSRILARQGSFLRPLDAHDIMCAVGNAAVSGGVRRCLPVGTRIHTRRGSIPIEEVITGDEVMTAVGYKPVTGWLDQGVQQIVELVTESGTIFRCTPDHRIAVLTDVWGGYTFKQAQHITPEDRILFITHAIGGKEMELASLPAKRGADHSGSVLSQPELNTETAWFMGKFFADGYVSVTKHDNYGKGGNTTFSVACHENEFAQMTRVTAWMGQHGLHAQDHSAEHEHCVKLRSNNRQIARWMYQYKQPHAPLEIPEEVWQATLPIRAAFIAGVMDGDGCYTDRPVTVVATVYETFARDMVKLLATLGIIAEVRVRRPATEQGWQAQWVVSIKDALALNRAESLLGSYASREWVSRHGKQAGYTVPGRFVKNDLPRATWKNKWPSSRDANMNSATLTTMVEATHYVPVQVVEIRDGGSAHTYDLEVQDGSTFVAEGYLVHNTAMISLFDYDDQEMRHCKDGDFWRSNSQRWNANNSAVWPDRELNQAEITRFVLDMVESGRGEPGIFNRRAAVENRPARRQAADFGTNPCVTADTWVMTQAGPRQVKDLVAEPFAALVNGRAYRSTKDGFFYTGHKPVYLIETEEGHTLKATADHPILYVAAQTGKKQDTAWRPVGELQPGDSIRLHNQRSAVWLANDQGAAAAWLLGLLVGDGAFVRHETKSNQAMLRFQGESSQMMVEMAHAVLTANVPARNDLQPFYHKTNQYWQLASPGLNQIADSYNMTIDAKTITPAIEQTSSAFYAGFLRGLFDADGAVMGNQDKGISVRLVQSNLELLQAAQRMLLRLGINSTIYQNHREAGYRSLPDGKGGVKEHWTEAQHELVIANDNIQIFQQRIGFSNPEKAARLADKAAAYQRKPDRERFVAHIKSITLVGHEDVYDCTIPEIHAFDANGLYVHNCGEIILRPYQFCNLTSAIARADDTYETLREKVELATIIGTIQSMATYFPGLRREWQKNCEEERLLGVDLNGQMDSPAVQDPENQAKLREVAVETNRLYADALGINQSVSITCVKPSGNSSQLVDSSSGLHARWAPFYIRNVRVGAHTPVFKVLNDAGVPMDPENGQTPENANTWVIHFPVKAPPDSVTRNDRTALEQCYYWLQNKTHYTEHNPSVTITYQPNEVLDIIRWIWENQDKVGGMAFLPAFDAQYDQMPYMEISQEEYEQAAAKFPEIDFSKIYRYEEEDLTTAAQELACLAGGCDV